MLPIPESEGGWFLQRSLKLKLTQEGFFRSRPIEGSRVIRVKRLTKHLCSFWEK